MCSAETIIVQELIPGGGGCQLSYAALCSEGRPPGQHRGAADPAIPAEFGRASTFVETVDEPDVVEGSRRILAAMGITGLVEVEFKRDPRTQALKLLDVNPRAWAGTASAPGQGLTSRLLLWQLVQGDPVHELHGIPGIKWRRLSWDLVAAANDLLRWPT